MVFNGLLSMYVSCIVRDSASSGCMAQAVCLRSHVIWVESFGAWFWKGCEIDGQIVEDYRRVSLNVYSSHIFVTIIFCSKRVPISLFYYHLVISS